MERIKSGSLSFKNIVNDIKESIYKASGMPFEIPIAGICDGIDGICSNTSSDRYTLPSRDLVSAEIESLIKYKCKGSKE